MADRPELEPVAWYLPADGEDDSMFRDARTVKACTGNPWTGWIPLHTSAQLAAAVAQARAESANLRTVAQQVLRDMQAQGVLLEWQTVLEDAIRQASEQANVELSGEQRGCASARTQG